MVVVYVQEMVTVLIGVVRAVATHPEQEAGAQSV